MQSVLQDLRHAARGLARNFRFTATVVFTLALGIGATTAIFTVVRSVLLNPLAYADADRLVAVFTRDTRGGGERAPSSPANFLDWKEHSGVFDHLTAASPWAPTLTGWDNPDQIEGLRASPALFDLLGVSPAMGRTFTAAGENSEDPRVVVLGHALWQRRFGADPQIVGKVLTLDREPYTVIGVMPPGFRFPPFWATDAEFWSPLVFTPQQTAQRRAQFLRVFGRLKPGFSLDQARAAMNTLAGRLAEQYPDSNRNLSVNVEPLKEPVVSGVRTSLLVLMGAVGLVLLIGCANVASLLLARGAGRGREVAVRLALGASRRRVVGQFLAESSLLALAGGAGGLALAAGGLDALVALGSGSVPRLQEVSMDGAILAFALGVSVLTGLGFGVAPALRASDLNLNEALKQGSRSASGSSTRAHNLLVAGEMALALLLLVGAGLLLQTFWNLRTLDPGFRTQNLLTASLPFAGSSHTTPAAQQALFDEILRRVHALPGVESAALVNHIPVGGDQWGSRFQAEGSIFTTLDDLPRVSFRVATPGYFRTMGTPILRGREFSEHDTADGNRVVVVNETFARTMWPNDDPVGQRIREGAPDWGRPWMTVVGVARDVRQWELTDTIPPEVYYPYSQ
ncbi:MAG TPA: ABC transporter permease, partial [Candidatus Acidoferrales bacterium]